MVDTGIKTVSQKMTELEVSLYNCKQNVQIPHVELEYDADIAKISAEVAKDGRELTMDDVPEEMLQNDTFINKIQSNVNVWIREIQQGINDFCY